MEHPTYDGTSEVKKILTIMEEKIGVDQRLLVIDLALQDNPARWWATHRALIV
jgi:hypothetical protein